MPQSYDRAPVYERIDKHGNVVERVQPIAGDFEDTRLGLLALEPDSGWRQATTEDTAVDAPDLDSASEQAADTTVEASPAPDTSGEPKPGRRRNPPKPPQE